MSLRRVRCPHCSRRFDVAGIPAGTWLRCGGCAAILAVPAHDAPLLSKCRFPILRSAGAAAAGLVTIAVLWMACRPSSHEETASTREPAPDRSASTVAEPKLGIIVDDPV